MSRLIEIGESFIVEKSEWERQQHPKGKVRWWPASWFKVVSPSDAREGYVRIECVKIVNRNLTKKSDGEVREIIRKLRVEINREIDFWTNQLNTLEASEVLAPLLKDSDTPLTEDDVSDIAQAVWHELGIDNVHEPENEIRDALALDDIGLEVEED